MLPLLGQAAIDPIALLERLGSLGLLALIMLVACRFMAAMMSRWCDSQVELCSHLKANSTTTAEGIKRIEDKVDDIHSYTRPKHA